MYFQMGEVGVKTHGNCHSELVSESVPFYDLFVTDTESIPIIFRTG